MMFSDWFFYGISWEAMVMNGISPKIGFLWEFVSGYNHQNAFGGPSVDGY